KGRRPPDRGRRHSVPVRSKRAEPPTPWKRVATRSAGSLDRIPFVPCGPVANGACGTAPVLCDLAQPPACDVERPWEFVPLGDAAGPLPHPRVEGVRRPAPAPDEGGGAALTTAPLPPPGRQGAGPLSDAPGIPAHSPLGPLPDT